MANEHLEGLDVKLKDGCGLACLHYGVETTKGASGDKFLEWMGGYFEPHWSVNPHWDAEFKELPEHPITRGVKPFTIRDEWYYHMRFVEGMKGVTPILSAHPPAETLSRKDGPHSGNPHVREAVARGEIQHVAWAYERPTGGRGFGFTGGHFHRNWANDDFRTIVLNAITWVAHAEVPEGGVPSDKVTEADLEMNQDFPKPAPKNP
jgi:type 1 glutamine amidotransferase